MYVWGGTYFVVVLGKYGPRATSYELRGVDGSVGRSVDGSKAASTMLIASKVRRTGN